MEQAITGATRNLDVGKTDGGGQGKVNKCRFNPENSKKYF
jgi:hypothetical protein